MSFYHELGADDFTVPLLWFFSFFTFDNWNGASNILFSTSMPFTKIITFVLKFSSAIALLILIRGGTPRYRYDYLTKLGWLKFLLLLISYFIVLFFFYLII